MPIKPENRSRYPVNWAEIREQILVRAGRRCEHPGCTAAHHEIGYWLDGTRWKRAPRELLDALGIHPLRLSESRTRLPIEMAVAEGGTIKVIRIVLTIAHLDHTPENCDPENLRAWCQRHHLAYDAAHHAVSRARTRRDNANTQELF